MFICTNQKSNDKPCCANHNSIAISEYAKNRAKELGLTKELQFKVSTSGCMGRCSDGPVLVIYPEGIWYSYQNTDDIDNILTKIANQLAIATENS